MRHCHERALREANRVYQRSHCRSWAQVRLTALLLAVACGLALVLVAGAVSGQEAAGDQRRRTIEVDGVPGLWFAASVAREMLADLQELPLVRQRVTLLEGQLALREDQVERLQTIVTLAEQAEARAVGALDAAQLERQLALEQNTAWWRSPVLWLAVGAVVAVGLVALSAWTLNTVATE